MAKFAMLKNRKPITLVVILGIYKADINVDIVKA